MSSCPSTDDLAACARGELDAKMQETIELHVDECSTCRITLSEACRRAVPESVTPSLPEVGDIVGRYEIGERLGEGAMGVVFAARDRELARDVAIKLLRPQLGASEDELVRARMLREGRAIARIDHPNVVRVLDVGEWRGARFVVMERLSGVTLREWLATKPSSAAIRDVLVQCARGLAAAHGVDVVHRDFKPDNVIVEADGHARVTDFGLAAESGVVSGELDTSQSPRLTRTHGALGTPAYMSPEQRRGEPVDVRSDQYTWCVVAVEALPLEQWPRRVRGALRRGLAEEPGERWPSFDELLTVTAPRHRVRFVVGAALVVAIVVAFALKHRAAPDTCDVTLGWSGSRAARAATAFTASSSAGAAAAWRYVDAAAARYETSWRALRRDACRDRQPAIARCLDRRRDELIALADRWRPGEKDALALAPQAIDALFPVESCRVPETAAAGERPELATRFAAARAERLTGQFARARTGFVDLLPLATDPAFRAEVLVELAASERNLHDSAASRAHVVEAIASAELAGASRTKVVAWLQLAELASQDLIELAQARDALQLATAVIERLGRPSDLARGLDFERGLLLIREGHPSDALVALEQSLPESAPSEQARRLLAIARAQLDMGANLEALASLERAKRTLTDALGPNAVGLASIENMMVDPLRKQARYDEAIVAGERALALLGDEEPTSPFRRGTLNNLATVYAEAGKLDRAIAIQTELLASATTDHDRALFESNLGSMLTQAHRHAEALAHLEHGRAVLGRLLGDDHPNIADVEHLLALLEIDRSRPDRALTHARTVLAIRKHTHASPGSVALASYLVAKLLVETGKRAEGVALARAALAEPLGDDDRPLATELRAFLARQARR